MNEVIIKVAGQLMNTVADYSNDKVQGIELTNLNLFKNLRYAVTAQCNSEQCIIMTTGNKNIAILNTKEDESDTIQYTMHKHGQIEIENGIVSFELSHPARILISKSTLVCDTEAKAITYTILLENVARQNDYNDICLSLTACKP